MFFVGSLRALTADISKRLSEKVAQLLVILNFSQLTPVGCICHSTDASLVYQISECCTPIGTSPQRARAESNCAPRGTLRSLVRMPFSLLQCTQGPLDWTFDGRNTRAGSNAHRACRTCAPFDFPSKNVHVNFCLQTNAGCAYLKQLCMDEFNLFREFFDSGEDQL